MTGKVSDDPDKVLVDGDKFAAANSGANYGPLASSIATYIASKLLISSSAWTPSDQSGAGLSFSNVDCAYQRVGNIVIAYGQITYPSTADASSARISLPVAPVSAGRGNAPGSVDSTVSNGLYILALSGLTAAGFYTHTTGVAATNANLSTKTIHFCLAYPVS